MVCFKGQHGIELLIIFSTALAVFIIFYALFAQQYSEGAQRQAKSDAISIADRIAGEINIAARAGNGYERKFEYPRKIPGATGYNISINNASGSVDVLMILGDGNVFEHTSPTLTRNITGEAIYATTSGYYLEMERGYAYVENRNGVIAITQMRVG